RDLKLRNRVGHDRSGPSNGIARSADASRKAAPPVSSTIGRPARGNEPCRPQYREYATGEPQHQKHDGTPWRDAKRVIDKQADAGPKQHAPNHLCRQLERTPEPRHVGDTTRRRRRLGRPACAQSIKSLAKPLEPRGESSFVW